MSTSNIEWTAADDGTPGKTWNPIVGCSMVSAGCTHCYAETMSKRLAAMAKADNDAGRNPGRKSHYLNVMNNKGRWNGHVDLVPEALADPFKWRKPCRVFVNSMSDLFHPDVPFEYVEEVWSVMALTPQHTYQILTKRPERMAEMLSMIQDRHAKINHENPAKNIGAIIGEHLYTGPNQPFPLPNVWIGTSTENQQTADERIPHLISCPAAVRFLSCEPLLGEIDLAEYVPCAQRDYGHDSVGLGIHWVIVGGESGPGARPCTIGHIRRIVRDCAAAGVSCFVKQLGSRPVNREGQPHPIRDSKGGDIAEFPEDLRVRQWPKAAVPV